MNPSNPCFPRMKRNPISNQLLSVNFNFSLKKEEAFSPIKFDWLLGQGRVLDKKSN